MNSKLRSQTSHESTSHAASHASIVSPGSFEVDEHFYPRVINAQLHPMVRMFLGMGADRIAERYCHLHPATNRNEVVTLLKTVPRWFRWAGADLFHVAEHNGARRMVLVETNSCPSGQKSMPMWSDEDEQAGYRSVLQASFIPWLRGRALPQGALAVLYDKNLVEASGYAAALADLMGEDVYLAPCFAGEHNASQVNDGVLSVRAPDGRWVPIRAAFRYVTQAPWTRLPPLTRTLIANPVISCLAGGRNKHLAALSYERFNTQQQTRGSGMQILVPETIKDVPFQQIPESVARFGGVAVVKNPYSNAGQGVWIITSPDDLSVFMRMTHRYDRYIVQSLIGNSGWAENTDLSRFFHVGTVPDRRGKMYVADLRMMVAAGPQGFSPVGMYARRAAVPLLRQLPSAGKSWAMLGTNLSQRTETGWTADTSRLMLMDNRDFNRLGLGLDDLIDAYLQTVMSVIAIDEMARCLVTQRGAFKRRAFAALNPDAQLNEEVVPC